ncbi:MAG: hypothetical protein ACR2FJ_09635 [Qipengyuania sp.]
MSAHSHIFDLSQATMLPPLAEGEQDAAALDLQARWSALHLAADAVAQQAQLGCERPVEAIASLPERACAAGGERLAAIEQGIGDLGAVMQTGLAALVGAADEGHEITAAALTLWREFYAARGAIVELLPPESGPA